MKPEDNIKTEIAEVIKKNHYSGKKRMGATKLIDQTAQEIDLLYNKRIEAQAGKTLALIASDADIPLWVAMACAKHGQQSTMDLVEKVIPKKNYILKVTQKVVIGIFRGIIV